MIKVKLYIVTFSMSGMNDVYCITGDQYKAQKEYEKMVKMWGERLISLEERIVEAERVE